MVDALGESFNAVKVRMWRMAKDGQLISEEGSYTVGNRNPSNSVTGKLSEGSSGYAGYRTL